MSRQIKSVPTFLSSEQVEAATSELGRPIATGLFITSFVQAMVAEPLVVSGAPLADAGSIVEAVERRLETIRQYRCRLHVLSILGAAREERVFDYAFQRPKLIRMNVLEGKDRGSALVYRDGKVRGHRGGLLAWIVLTREPSHPDVVTIRGGRVDQSDLLFITDVLRNAVHEGTLRLSGMEQLHGREHYRLDLLRHVKPLEDGAERGRVWIDQERFVVAQYELYDKAGHLIYRQAHEKLELNVSLPDGLFRL